MNFLKYFYVVVLKKIEVLSAIAVRLTKLTGKSAFYIHPKHLINEEPWFTDYLKSGDIIADLGAGNGANSIKAAKIVKEVHCLERDNALIEVAKKSSSLKKIKNIKFQKTDLEKKLRLKTKSLDAIVFLDVLEHLVNRSQILKEIRRVLKPNGLLLIGVPNSETSWKKLQRSVGLSSFSDPDHKVEFTENEITNLLKKHNFKIVSLNYGKLDTPLRGLYDVTGAFCLPLYKKITNWRQQQSLKNPKESSGFEIVARNSK